MHQHPHQDPGNLILETWTSVSWPQSPGEGHPLRHYVALCLDLVHFGGVKGTILRRHGRCVDVFESV